jgi:hypothetical protein
MPPWWTECSRPGAAARVALVCALAPAAPAAAGAAPGMPEGEIAPGRGVDPTTLDMPLGKGNDAHTRSRG